MSKKEKALKGIKTPSRRKFFKAAAATGAVAAASIAMPNVAFGAAKSSDEEDRGSSEQTGPFTPPPDPTPAPTPAPALAPAPPSPLLGVDLLIVLHYQNNIRRVLTQTLPSDKQSLKTQT